MALSFNKVTGDITPTSGVVKFNGGELTGEMIEYADFTNGGEDDINSYDFTHTMEAGYSYVLHIRDLSQTAVQTSYSGMSIELRNDAGTWVTTNGYAMGEHDADGTAGTTRSHQNSAWLMPYLSGFTGAHLFDYTVMIMQPMNTSARTSFLVHGHGKGNGIALWTGHGQIHTIDGYDKIRLIARTTPNAPWDNGHGYLYRIKEPS